MYSSNYSNTENDERKSNRIVANCLQIASIIIIAIWICHYFDVFKFANDDNYYKVSYIISFCFVGFLIPGLLVNIFNFKNPCVKYIVLTICICLVFSTYVFFGIYCMLILLLPFLLSQVYYNRAVTVYTAVLSIAMIFISQLLSKKYCLLDMSTITFEQMYLPIIFQLSVLFITGLYVSSKNITILNSNINSNNTVMKQKKLLTTIMEKSHLIFSSVSLADLHRSIKEVLMEILRPYQKSDKMVFHIGLISDDYYFNLDYIDEYKKIPIENNRVTIKCHGFVINIDVNSLDHTPITILDHCLIVKTYDNSKLNYFIVIEMNVDKNDPALFDVLSIMQKNIEVATNNLILNFDLQTTQAEMIYAFAKVSESKSHQTGNHIRRVSEYMKLLCKEAGYSAAECQKIGVAAMMHDIGKLFIPDEIIEKKGKLTNAEYDIVKQHIYKGEELLEKCPGDVMEYARIMIREHHEHYDGKGYIGLAGENIHFLSRLIAVADVFDALISKRSYKPGWDPNEAFDLIINESGKQFDPSVVEIFKKCFLELIFVSHKFPDKE